MQAAWDATSTLGNFCQEMPRQKKYSWLEPILHTIVSYNASVVKTCNATKILVRFLCFLLFITHYLCSICTTYTPVL
jgi:hypothetical protein